MLNPVLNGDGSTSAFFAAHDGVRLHARLWTPLADEGRLPVVCLPDLTRNSTDFVPLATALSRGSASRRVVALDYRGRGRSGDDPDGRYELATERRDMLHVLDELGIARADFVGTSRGGLHVMTLAAEHRALIAAVVLNDIGPVLDPVGLARIKGYVGRPAAPASLDEAVRLLKLGAAATGFDGLGAEEWRHFARSTFAGEDDDLHLRYDPRVASALDDLDLSRPLPDLWATFDLLRPTPVLTIRGANSDLLSPETLDAMTARWNGNRAHVVPGQAHAPLLADRATIDVVAAFLAATGSGSQEPATKHAAGAPRP